MTKESKYAIFNFQECDSDLIPELSSYLDDRAEEIHNFFEVKCPDSKVIIDIVPTKKEFDDLFRKVRGMSETEHVVDWMIGNCRDGVITYLSLHDFNSTKSHAFKEEEFEEALDYYKKTIVHEYVHFVNKIFNKIHNCPATAKFLREGIACYLSGQKEGKALLLKSSKSSIANDENCSYGDYYLVTKYLVENYNKEYVLNAFREGKENAVKLLDEIYEKIKEEESTRKE